MKYVMLCEKCLLSAFPASTVFYVATVFDMLNAPLGQALRLPGVCHECERDDGSLYNVGFETEES